MTVHSEQQQKCIYKKVKHGQASFDLHCVSLNSSPLSSLLCNKCFLFWNDGTSAHMHHFLASILRSTLFLSQSRCSFCFLWWFLSSFLLRLQRWCLSPNLFGEGFLFFSPLVHVHTEIKKRMFRNRKYVVLCSHPPSTHLLCSFKKSTEEGGKWEDAQGATECKSSSCQSKYIWVPLRGYLFKCRSWAGISGQYGT